MMYKSQFHKNDPHDWFCAPGSQMSKNVLHVHKDTYLYKLYVLIYELLLDFIYVLTSYGNIFDIWDCNIPETCH